MKTNIFLSMICIILFVSCQKQDENIPKETKALINDNIFIPSKSLSLKSGNRYIISFVYENQKIEIITSDTISGIYTISSGNIKSSKLLKAILTYTDDDVKFIGRSGEVEITKGNSGSISGSYNATVSDGVNSMTIEEGYFTSIQPKEELPFIETETAILDTLGACYETLYDYIEKSYIFDAVYSNSIPSPGGNWTEIYEHKQTQFSENEKISFLWNDAYGLIYKINLVIKSAELMLPETNSRNLIVAQSKAIRALLAYNLMSWFGEIPIEKEFYMALNPRSNIPDIISQIVQDATEAKHLLPVNWTGTDSYRIPKNLMTGLLARVYLTDFNQRDSYPLFETGPNYSNNYTESIYISNQLIYSGLYSLGSIKDSFSASDKEIIWGFQKGNNTEFNQIFNKGSFVPFLRLTEIYLILSEALLQNKDSENALALINQINSIRGNPVISSIVPDDIYKLWNTEMNMEGSLFLIKKRFSKAMAFLQNNATKMFLPVPYSAILENPYLTQNVGY